MTNNKSVNDNNINNSLNYTSKNNLTNNSGYFSSNKIQTQSLPKTEMNPNAKTKNKLKNVAKVLTTFATMLSATTLCIVGTDALSPATVQGYICETKATTSEIYYMISLTEFNGEDDIYVVLYNDFVNYAQKVEDSYADGCFDGLVDNMNYTLALKQGNITITSQKIRTKPTDDEIIDYTQPDYTGRDKYYYDDSGGQYTEPITSDDPTYNNDWPDDYADEPITSDDPTYNNDWPDDYADEPLNEDADPENEINLGDETHG